MLYNSLSYLVFFAIVFAANWLAPTHRARLLVLLVASWIFYAAWYPIYLLLLLFVTLFTYAAGIWIGTPDSHPRWPRKGILIAAVAADLLILGYFKYTGFVVNSVAMLNHALGGRWHPPAPHVVLPLGISFFTFQSIAYVVDVFRGEVQPVRNPLCLALFKAFFPQLIAGPIVRADELIPQFTSPRPADSAQMQRGLDLVALGLFKKVVVADQVAGFADRVFAHPQGFSSAVLLLGVYAYAAQIYCDFSGYTDIGRGCAKLLGFELPLNFNMPYAAVNIVDFWRRWHISLSRWLRDYLYIPLGGSRRGAVRTYVNLFITMLLGGLWHGANWTFVAWGALHGAALAVTRWVHDRAGIPGEQPLLRGRAYRVFSVMLTFHFVCFAWILFRAPSFTVASEVILGIARLTRLNATDVVTFGWTTIGLTAVALGGLYPLHLLAPRLRLAQDGWSAGFTRALAYAAVVIAITLVSTGGAQQFIYFQF